MLKTAILFALIILLVMLNSYRTLTSHEVTEDFEALALFDDFKEKVNNYTLENKERYAKQNKKVQKEISINIDCFYCEEEDLWVEF